MTDRKKMTATGDAAPLRLRQQFAQLLAGAQRARMFGVHQQAGQCAGADLAQVLKFDAGRDEFIARGRVIRQSQPRTRSEEHTSELQSLMRSSYAVFCLTKKTK